MLITNNCDLTFKENYLDMFKTTVVVLSGVRV